ncbi:MAG: hypothetical protein FWF35_05710 [Elusimicrobia bacterium]|nr:hypothetical protein [Elusimicrobiota bacterium]
MKKLTFFALLFSAAFLNAQTAVKLYPVAGDAKLISNEYVLPMQELIPDAKGQIKIAAVFDKKEGLYISPLPEGLEDAADFTFTLQPFVKDEVVWFKLNLKYKNEDFERNYQFLKFDKNGGLLSVDTLRCAVSKDGKFSIADAAKNEKIDEHKPIDLSIPPVKPLPETLNMQISFFFDDTKHK